MTVSDELRERILECIFGGASYRQAARENNVSIGVCHNIVKETKKKIVDFDEIRRFLDAFKKNKLNSFDAARASKLAEIMNKCNLNLDDLQETFDLIKKLLSSKNLQSSIIGEAVEFELLRKGMAKSGKEFLVYCNQKRQEACQNQKQVEDATKELRRVKSETKKVSAALSVKKKELGVYKPLSSVGLEKLAQVAQFMSEFESLGFDTNEVKKIADLRLKLKKVGVDTDNMDKDIVERGSLKDQNESLRISLQNGNHELEEQSSLLESFRAKNSVHRFVDQILETGTAAVICKYCGTPLVFRVDTAEIYKDLQAKGNVQPIYCPECGIEIEFTASEIIIEIVRPMLPIFMPS